MLTFAFGIGSKGCPGPERRCVQGLATLCISLGTLGRCGAVTVLVDNNSQRMVRSEEVYIFALRI